MITLKEHLIRQKVQKKQNIIGRYEVREAGWNKNKSIYTIYAYRINIDDFNNKQVLIKYVYQSNNKIDEYIWCIDYGNNEIVSFYHLKPGVDQKLLTQEEADDFIDYFEKHKNDML